jgi:hypothetical protein
MRRVIVESPYAGNVDRNVAYARRCLADALRRGEAPIASHLLYTQVLDDADPEQRATGLAAGHAWIGAADAMLVYDDYGISPGMREAIRRASSATLYIEYRRIGPNPEDRS